MGHYEPGIGYETFPAPGLDVGESCEASVVRQGNHGLSSQYFFTDIFRCAVGNTCFPFEGRNVDLVADCLGVNCVAPVCHHYFNFHIVFVFIGLDSHFWLARNVPNGKTNRDCQLQFMIENSLRNCVVSCKKNFPKMWEVSTPPIFGQKNKV